MAPRFMGDFRSKVPTFQNKSNPTRVNGAGQIIENLAGLRQGSVPPAPSAPRAHNLSTRLLAPGLTGACGTRPWPYCTLLSTADRGIHLGAWAKVLASLPHLNV